MKLFFLFSMAFMSQFLLNAQNGIDLNTLPAVEDYTVIRSYPSADTVIIGLHGGPTDELYPGNFIYFEDIPTISVVEMQQYQHIYPEIMEQSALTLAEAIKLNDTTVALLQKTVLHYTAMNKTVVLMGHSLGAFFLTEYVDDYGVDDIHRIIPMAGRLNMNPEIVTAFENGYLGSFIDGISTTIATDLAMEVYWAGMKIQAGLGANRYVDSLGTMDLSKMLYVYGTKDNSVGSLLPAETSMLENTNASILAMEDGDHGSPFDPSSLKAILDFIRADLISGNSFTVNQAAVSFYPTIVKQNLTVDAQKKGLLTISNLSGQHVHQENCTSGNQTINLTNLTSGMYIATYRTADNEWKVQKIIIQ